MSTRKTVMISVLAGVVGAMIFLGAYLHFNKKGPWCPHEAAPTNIEKDNKS